MSWDDEAATWDDNPAVRAYSRAAAQSLIDLADRLGTGLSGRVLDFGCGTGLLTEFLATHAEEVVAIDLSEQMIAVLREKRLPRVTALVGEVGEHELGPVDWIVCSSVCAFLEDYPGTVRELAEHLEPDGVFVQWDWELDPTADAPSGLSREQIRGALEGAGLVDVEVGVGFEVAVGDQTMAPLIGHGRRGAG